VQQVHGESQGKQQDLEPSTTYLGSTTAPGNTGTLYRGNTTASGNPGNIASTSTLHPGNTSGNVIYVDANSLEQTEDHVMMVGSWPCKVSSEININGRCVSEPICEDKGKTTAPKPENRKDLKRACVVLSKGREVVGLGYSRVTGVAVEVTDKKENSGNHGRVNRVSKTEQHYLSRVNRVSQNSNMDRQADRVGQVTRVSPTNNTGQRTDQAS
jgi:hypothetical protein